MLSRIAAPLVLALTVHTAYGAGIVLYECTNADGGKLLTNVPDNPKACRQIIVPGSPPPAAPTAAAPGAPATSSKGTAPRAAPVPSPATFPRVDRETQQSRDSQRRRILDQELANEQRLLDQAKKELAAQESVRLGTERNYQKVLDRIEPYQKKVKQHEDNVAGLKRELSNLR